MVSDLKKDDLSPIAQTFTAINDDLKQHKQLFVHIQPLIDLYSTNEEDENVILQKLVALTVESDGL